MALDGQRARGALEVFRSTAGGLGGVLRYLVLPLLVHPLLHAGPLHALGNVLVLSVFGARLERRTSWWRFAAFLVLCGTLSGLLHVLVTIDEAGPRLGASVLAGSVALTYLLLYRRARIRVLVLPLPLVIQVPAVVVGGIWGVAQFHKVQDFLTLGYGTSFGYRVTIAGVLGGGLLLGPGILGWKRRRAGVR
jgi:membrane associated rhomboid family serine protease